MRNKSLAILFALFSLMLLSAGYLYAAESEDVELKNAATTCLHSGKFDEAIKLYEKALAKAQDPALKAGILLGLSSCYLEKGIEPFSSKKDSSFYKKSMQYANECLKIVPNQWQALGNVGTIYMNMGDYEKADSCYREAMKYVDKGSVFYKRLLEQHKMILTEIEHNKKGSHDTN